MNSEKLLHLLLEKKKMRNISPEQLEAQITNWVVRSYHKTLDADEKKLLPISYLLKSAKTARDISVDAFSNNEVAYLSILEKYVHKILGIQWGEGGVQKNHYKKLFNMIEKHGLKGTNWTIYKMVGTGYKWGYITVQMERYANTIKKPKYLYHVTPIKNIPSINRQGLKPMKRPDRTKGFHYLKPRIYLSSNKGDALNAFIADYGHKKHYALYRVDTSKFSKFNLFTDHTTFSNAVYTLTHIPAKALQLIRRTKHED